MSWVAPVVSTKVAALGAISKQTSADKKNAQKDKCDGSSGCTFKGITLGLLVPVYINAKKGTVLLSRRSLNTCSECKLLEHCEIFGWWIVLGCTIYHHASRANQYFGLGSPIVELLPEDMWLISSPESWFSGDLCRGTEYCICVSLFWFVVLSFLPEENLGCEAESTVHVMKCSCWDRFPDLQLRPALVVSRMDLAAAMSHSKPNVKCGWGLLSAMRSELQCCKFYLALFRLISFGTDT